MFNRKVRGLLTIAGGVLFAATAAMPASAASSTGGLQLTIPVAVYSITVGPTNGSFGSCQTKTGTPTVGLTFPNGTCHAPVDSTGTWNDIVITNTGNRATIDVQGATQAIPSSGTAAWNLCVGTACNTGTPLPGQDQFMMWTINHTLTGPNQPIGPGPTCDLGLTAAGTSCVADANAVYGERILLTGPTASTDPSLSFSTSVTWTAVP